MTNFIPKNFKKILQNTQIARDYFLKPYGFDTPKNKNFPKKHPQYKFFEHKIILHRPGNQVNNNILTFKCDQKLSKPEIKQYLQKLYNINIEKLNTVRYLGKVKRNIMGAPMVTKNFKKAYVMIDQQVDSYLNTIE